MNTYYVTNPKYDTLQIIKADTFKFINETNKYVFGVYRDDSKLRIDLVASAPFESVIVLKENYVAR